MKRKLGNYRDALSDLNRANELNPQSSWILGYATLNHVSLIFGMNHIVTNLRS